MEPLRQHPYLDALATWCVHTQQASPCAVVACAYPTPDGWRIDQGAAGHLAPGCSPANTNTVFDLASLTKPFAALTFARLVQQGLLDWNTPLDVPLREAHGTPSAKVPIGWLLAHRSGLEGHRPLYAPLERGQQIDRFAALREACNARRPECDAPLSHEDGYPPVYSDLGYLLLGEAMARASGLPVDNLIAREVCQPLNLPVRSARQWHQLDASFDHQVARTEHVAWRGGLLCGAVHDENAWALGREGACAHAGLFGTAIGVARFGMAVLDACNGRHPLWLMPSSLEPVLRVRQGGTLRAGFDGKSALGSTAGTRCSATTFGHLGFTGTSVWIDPTAGIVTVLLTNRVCPSRTSNALQRVRPKVHEALFAWGLTNAHGIEDDPATRCVIPDTDS